jgi:hypothetical protein
MFVLLVPNRCPTKSWGGGCYVFLPACLCRQTPKKGSYSSRCLVPLEGTDAASGYAATQLCEKRAAGVGSLSRRLGMTHTQSVLGVVTARVPTTAVILEAV